MEFDNICSTISVVSQQNKSLDSQSFAELAQYTRLSGARTRTKAQETLLEKEVQ